VTSEAKLSALQVCVCACVCVCVRVCVRVRVRVRVRVCVRAACRQPSTPGAKPGMGVHTHAKRTHAKGDEQRLLGSMGL